MKNGKERKKEAGQPTSQTMKCANVGKLLLFPKKHEKKTERKAASRLQCHQRRLYVRLYIQIELYIISRAFKLRSGLVILRSRISICKLLFRLEQKLNEL